MNRAAIKDTSNLNFARWDWASLLLLGLATLFVLITFSDFGVTFDEPRQQLYADYVLDFYLTGGKAPWRADLFNMALYGGAFEGTAAALQRMLPFSIWDTRHLLNAFVGIFGGIGVWKLTRYLGGSRAAFLSGLLLFLLPSYLGHSFNNPKDIPFAVGYVWTLYFILRMLPLLPRPPWKLIVGLGLSLGLTLGVRVGGVLLIPYLGLACAIFLFFPKLCKTGAEPKFWKRFQWLAITASIVLAMAYVVMLLCWPSALQAPITQPLAAIEAMSNFVDWDDGTVLYAGKDVPATDLPWHYLPHYFMVKLPELFLIGLPVGAIIWALKQRKKRSTLKLLQLVILLTAIFFPPVTAVLKHSILYDGLRHFLFLLPLLTILCALAWNQLLNIPQRMPRQLATAILCLLCLRQVWSAAVLHPNHYCYYNVLTGGVSGAYERYEMDYWANSFREAVDLIVEDAKARDGQAFADKKYLICFIDNPYLSATPFFPPNFERSDNPGDYDYALSHTRWKLQDRMPGKPIAEVGASGAIFSVITINPKHLEGYERL